MHEISRKQRRGPRCRDAGIRATGGEAAAARGCPFQKLAVHAGEEPLSYAIAQPEKGATVALPETLMQSDETMHLNGKRQQEKKLLVLEKCIDSLQDDQKQAVSLFYLREKSYHEIVAETGIEWNRVRSLIQNGRRNLKICMEKNSDGDDE